MLVKEQNEYVTQTGPGTPMGQLFRSYWIPALLSWELPKPDCPPVRVRILSEKLIAFRDTQGRLGLIEEFCAHRRASLWFGRNEENGLRCSYHGWKFDVHGQCMEIPSEPAGSTHCQRIRMTNYPLVERGGILWTYMGPPDRQPPLPEWEFTMVPESHRYLVETAGRNATGCRRWKAELIPAMCPSCIAAIWKPIRCSKARKAIATTWAT